MENCEGRKPEIKNILMIFLIVTLIAMSAEAEQDNIRFEHISLKEGLPQVTVNSIIQDKTGFLWFGTLEGLCRYDGYEFKIFSHDSNDKKNSLSDQYVWVIVEDYEGKLWIGTNDGGLNKFDPETEKFTCFKHTPDDPDSVSHNYITSIAIDNSGKIWAGTKGGGLDELIDEKQKKFRHFKHVENDKNSLSNNEVNSIYKDKNGTLWIGTSNGLNKLIDEKSKRFERFQHTKDEGSLSHNDVISLFRDSEETLWVGTNGGGLNKLINEDLKQFKNYKYDPEKKKSLTNNVIRVIFENKENNLWIGTENGLNLLERKHDGFKHYIHNDVIRHSLSHSNIYSIYEDNSGVLWIGTYSGGLNKYYKKYFKLDQHIPGDRNSLSNNEIRSIFQDNDYDRTVWIGTAGGGLNKYNPNKNKWAYYKTVRNGVNYNDVRTIKKARNGTLWVGTMGGGVFKYNSVNDKFIAVFGPYGDRSETSKQLSSNLVRVIIEDKDGLIWIGTDGGGINKYNPKTQALVIYSHSPNDKMSLSDNRVFSIHEDSFEVLWIGTRNGGLNKYNKESDTFTHFSTENSDLSHNFILSIYENHSNNLWIGTYGGGLNKITDGEKGKAIVYRKEDGLPNDTVYAIAEDRSGNLWMSTNYGLSKFNPNEETFKNYFIEDGLQSNEFNAGAYFHNQTTGKMFFGGAKGLNSFTPDEIKSDKNKPPIVFTNFILNGNSKCIQAEKVEWPLQKTINYTSSITLPYDYGTFSLEFSALHYRSPSRNKFKYKLEGFHSGMTCTDYKHRRATYTNLDPGKYKFTVIGNNKDGVWNNTGKSITIIISRPWWLTWYAFTIYFMFALFLILLIANASSKKALKRQVTERTQKLKETQAHLIQSEKMSALGTLVAGVAHEINNPTSAAIIESHNLKRDTGKLKKFIDELTGNDADEEIIKAFDEKFAPLFSGLVTLNESTNRIKEIVRNLRLFSRMDTGELKHVDFHDGLNATIELVKGSYKDDVEFISDFASNLEILGNVGELNQVFMNILQNGCYSIKQKQKNSGIKSKGMLTIKTKKIKDSALISFKDTGIGMTGEVEQKIFDPFFTTKPEGEGTGLGLSISFAIIENHHGRIEVEAELGQGTTIKIYLPLVEMNNHSAERK